MAKLPFKTMTDLAREELIRAALEPQSRPRHVEHIAEDLGCSRTPVSQALSDLSSIGLYEGQRWVSVRPVFAGALDIRQRALTLCGALETGRKGTTLFAAAAAVGRSSRGRSFGSGPGSRTGGVWISAHRHGRFEP